MKRHWCIIFENYLIMLYVLKILMTYDYISLFQVNISDMVKFSEPKNKSRLTLIYLHNINKDLDVNINFILITLCFCNSGINTKI